MRKDILEISQFPKILSLILSTTCEETRKQSLLCWKSISAFFVVNQTYHCVKCIQVWSFFWSAFSHIRTEYGEIRSISPYSVWMRENTDQKNLRIWTHFTQCSVYKIRVIQSKWQLDSEFHPHLQIGLWKLMMQLCSEFPEGLMNWRILLIQTVKTFRITYRRIKRQLYYAGQNIWTKIKKSSRTGQDIYFCLFVDQNFHLRKNE